MRPLEPYSQHFFLFVTNELDKSVRLVFDIAFPAYFM